MTLQQLLSPLLSNWQSFTLLFGFYVLFKFLTSPSFKGRVGEWAACRGLNHLDPQLYRQFHDLYLPRPDGLLAWIGKHSAPLLDPDAVRNANSRLESLCQSTDRDTAARTHLKALKTRNA